MCIGGKLFANQPGVTQQGVNAPYGTWAKSGRPKGGGIAQLIRGVMSRNAPSPSVTVPATGASPSFTGVTGG